MAWLGGWFDPELEELFHDEPELLETARQVRASRPQAEPDPRFQNRLRAQILAEASRGRYSRRGVRRWWSLGPTHFAWGGGAVGVALIGATVLTLVLNHPADQSVSGFSQLAAQHSVSPNQVITVAFNQPMNELAVERGVHIEPATKVSFSWKNNDLVISPAYHLTSNTPYTVTIDKAAIRAVSGASAAAPINITFATAPTPTPAPAAPPSLTPVVLGSNAAEGSLFFAPEPDGSVVSTVGVAPQGAASSSPQSGTAVAATPTATPTAAPEGGATGSLVEFRASGGPIRLGPSPSAAAFSPNDSSLATAVDDGNGGSYIVASQSDGTKKTRLTDSSTPVTALTWWSNDRIVYTDGTSINSIDVTGAKSSIYTVPTGGGTIAALAPGGAYAYIAPASGTGGNLLNVDTGTEQVLQGAAATVAFSGNGATVAWVDASGSSPHLYVEPVTQNAHASVSLPGSTATVNEIALDNNGGEAAFLATDAAGATQLVVAQVATATQLAVWSPADVTHLALSPTGDRVAFVSPTSTGASVEQAVIPGVTEGPTPTEIPAAATSTLRSFVAAQVGQDGQPDSATLAALSADGVNAMDNTPHHLSRAYVISTYLAQGGGVEAKVELVVDPNVGHTTPRVADETLVLAQNPASGYLVTSVTTTPLQDEFSGPHIISVTSSTASGVTTLQVSFDSDLNPASVESAISVFSASGSQLASSASYNSDTRMAVVTITNAPSGTLTLDIATSLSTFDGQQHLATSFETQVGANS